MEPLLSIENLKTYFFTSSGTVKTVDDVSLSVRSSGRLGIVGESGCGKSMTALSILRLVSSPGKIVGGKVFLDGAKKNLDLISLPEQEMRKIRGGRIAMIFQDPMTSLNPVFTIGDQIEEAVALHQNLPKNKRWEAVIESLRKVKIPDSERVAKSYPHELSGGMRQRAMIAMALSCKPDLLIADEPTTALDVTIQAQVLLLLKELQEELKMAFILITHDLGIIAETVEDVVVMYAGKVVERASTEKLFEHPRHPYTRALLQSVPTLESRGRLATIAGSVPDLSHLPQGCLYQDRCERVQSRCRQEDPPLFELAPGHDGRCFFPYE